MPRQVDSSPFRVGENVGATPGQVVFRNEVLEILQYTPTTPTVRTVPLLIVWSVINRHYILDLAKDRSFIEYAVGQGLQVFVTSWRNPTAEHADWNLDTYAQALLDATDAIREITGSEQIGTVGLCAGGQLLAAVMAHLQGAGDDRIAHAGFGVSQIDMSVPNVAGLALHPALHGAARLGTEAAGVVDGRAIAAVFSWLRPTELVWNQWVNNYLLGKDAAAVRHPRVEQRHDARVRGPAARPAADRDGQPAGHPGRPDPARHPGGPRRDHRRHLRRRRRDRPPRPVAGRLPLDPAVRRRLDLRALRRRATSSTWSTRPATPRPTSGPVRSPGTTPTPGSRARPSRPGTWWPHWADWAIARSGEEQPGSEEARQPSPPGHRGGPGAVRDGAMTVTDSTHVIDGLSHPGAGQWPGPAPAAHRRRVEPGAHVRPVLPLPRRVPHHRLRPARRSARPTCRARPYSVQRLAGFAAGVLAAVGVGRAHVLGVSLGGAVAQELARSHPDRVDRLVLVSTGPGAIGRARQAGRAHAVRPTDGVQRHRRARAQRRAHLRRPAARAARARARLAPAAAGERQGLAVPARRHHRLEQPAVAAPPDPADPDRPRRRRPHRPARQRPR